MDRKTYDRITGREFLGRKVRSNAVIRNGYMELPEGTLFSVQRKHNGLHLVSDPCETCGIKVYVHNVNPDRVDLIN